MDMLAGLRQDMTDNMQEVASTMQDVQSELMQVQQQMEVLQAEKTSLKQAATPAAADGSAASRPGDNQQLLSRLGQLSASVNNVKGAFQVAANEQPGDGKPRASLSNSNSGNQQNGTSGSASVDDSNAGSINLMGDAAALSGLHSAVLSWRQELLTFRQDSLELREEIDSVKDVLEQVEHHITSSNAAVTHSLQHVEQQLQANTEAVHGVGQVVRDVGDDVSQTLLQRLDELRNELKAEVRDLKRTGTSKYDFFKVKVWLGENMDHYYVLSRFLICRMLTVTKIPYIKAVKIALETKKYLAQLESVLFSIIRSKGLGEQYIDCYRLVTQFYQQRQPLCILICGTAWTGKSTIAQQLAARINIPNVMQTDVIYELLRAAGDTPLSQQPLWCRPGLSDAAVVGEFRREARVVRKGMDGDLVKTLSDGKPIIIEGLHLDPDLYISDFGSRGIIMLPARPPTTRFISPSKSSSATAVGPLAAEAQGASRSVVASPNAWVRSVVAQTTVASAAGLASGSKVAVTAEDAIRRMRLLQEYLCAYEAQGLPVVKVSYGSFGEALDKLHEYILQCIKVAMESSVAVDLIPESGYATEASEHSHVLQEASRLVFVFVKDSKPRRKVAIPVLDSYSWEQFLDQVKAKLKVAGVADIYLSANGHRVRNVSELQDIDELCVVEGPEVATANGSSAFSAAVQQRSTAELPQLPEPAFQDATALPIMSPSMRQQSMQERHKVAISADGLHSSGSLGYGADDDDNKYVRRAHPVRRWLQRILPNMFAPGLPVTNR
eukprot:gene11609-11753_t